jgi:hypothetical protein
MKAVLLALIWAHKSSFKALPLPQCADKMGGKPSLVELIAKHDSG